MELDKSLEISVLASIQAGKRIMEIYNTDFSVEYKTDSSPLTVADKGANEIITEFLNTTDYPILSEEGKQIDFAEREQWPVFWMVDPLDGTKEFVKKNGEFTVNIALIEKQTAVSGVIFAPAKDVLYFGTKGKGSFMLDGASNIIDKIKGSEDFLNKLIEMSIKLPLQNSGSSFTAVASRSHLSEETQLFIESLRKEHGEVNFISSGSSLKICLVAQGSADVYPRLAPTMEWDTAAGQAIAENAGCKVIQYQKNEQVVYNKKDLLNPFFIVSRN